MSKNTIKVKVLLLGLGSSNNPPVPFITQTCVITLLEPSQTGLTNLHRDITQPAPSQAKARTILKLAPITYWGHLNICSNTVLNIFTL